MGLRGRYKPLRSLESCEARRRAVACLSRGDLPQRGGSKKDGRITLRPYAVDNHNYMGLYGRNLMRPQFAPDRASPTFHPRVGSLVARMGRPPLGPRTGHAPLGPLVRGGYFLRKTHCLFATNPLFIDICDSKFNYLTV